MGALAASGKIEKSGAEWSVFVSAGGDPWGRKGGCGSLGGGGGRFACPALRLHVPCLARLRSRVTGDTSQSSKVRKAVTERRETPESDCSSAFSCSLGDGEVGMTRHRAAPVGVGWVAMRLPRHPPTRVHAPGTVSYSSPPGAELSLSQAPPWAFLWQLWIPSVTPETQEEAEAP